MLMRILGALARSALWLIGSPFWMIRSLFAAPPLEAAQVVEERVLAMEDAEAARLERELEEQRQRLREQLEARRALQLTVAGPGHEPAPKMAAWDFDDDIEPAFAP